MSNVSQPYAVHRDGHVETDFDPWVQRVLVRISQHAYVRDQHRRAIARHSAEIARLRAELERQDAPEPRR